MVSPSAHVAAVVMLLLGMGTDEGESYSYRSSHAGRLGLNRWPSAFQGGAMDTGAFRPFHGNPRGGSILHDIFQDVVGDITKVARDLSAGTSTRVPRHEVIESQDAVTLIVDLPGCNKQDIDAQISEDSGTKTLKITAVRKKPRRADQQQQQQQPTAGAKVSSSSLSSDGTAVESYEEASELSFRIGEGIDLSGVRGKLENGVLTLVLPRVAPEPPADPIEIPIDPPVEEGAGSAGANGQEALSGASTGGTGRDEERSSDSSGNTHISLS